MLKITKSILSLILVATLLFSAIFIGISIEADPATTKAVPTNILEGKTVKLYRTNLSPSLTHNTDYTPQNYANLSECGTSNTAIVYGEDFFDADNDGNKLNDFVKYNTLGEEQSELLKLLAVRENTRGISIRYTSSADPLNYRAGLLYDLGEATAINGYTLDITQKSNYVISNFSVYAGNTADATIFQNKIGSDGGSDSKLSVTLNCQQTARYILIMFDHVATKTSNKVSKYNYKPTISNVIVYNPSEQDDDTSTPNIIEGNTAKILRTTLATALTNKGTYSPSTYTDISVCGDANDFIAYGQDTNDKDNNADTDYLSYTALLEEQNDLLTLLTTKGNTRGVRIEHSSGGTNPLSYRSGLVYDLGAYYKLDDLQLEQKSSYSIHNFSVYAGDKFNANIFDNKIGEGGGISGKLSVNFSNVQSVRYVVIMFDHVSVASSNKVYQLAYLPTLTQVKIHGEKVADLPLSIIEGKTAKIYRTDLATPLGHQTDYDVTLPTTYNNLSGCAPTADFITWKENNDTYSSYTALGCEQEDLLNLLTTKNNTIGVQLQHSTGQEYPLAYRVGYVYDLGAYYKLNKLLLLQKSGFMIYNFSVYAGNKLDATIFQNKIGEGGGTDGELTATFASDESARYILIMFDHVSNDSNKVNMFTYRPTLTNIELYGEKTADLVIPQSIIEGKTAKIYRTNLETPLSQGADYSPLTYTTISGCAPVSDFVTHSTDINDKNENGNTTELLAYTDIGSIKGLGESQDDLLKLLTTKNNTREVKLEHTSGGEHPLSYRVGLLYDLGAYYMFDEIALKQKSSLVIHNFSVYAGNKLDASIFRNKIGEGGGSGSDLSATLDSNKSARYILIMFDHVSDATNKINMYTYKPTLTQVEIFGQKTADLVIPQSIIEGKAAKIYRTNFETPLTQGADYSPLTYTTISGCAPVSDFVTHSTDINDKNENGNTTELLAYTDIGSIKGLGESQDDLLKLLTTKNNTREVKLEHTSGGEHPLSYRVGLLYDLGAFYKFNEIALKQKSSIVIHKFSVYAGNKLDATIFQNKIGEGGGSGSDLSATLESEESARYILIMFDHVSDATNKINMYTYKPTLTQVEIFGQKTADWQEPESIINGNTTASLVRTDLSPALTQGANYTALTYDNLSVCAASGDFVTFSTDINDKDNDGNTTELLAYTDVGKVIGLGESQEDLLKLLTTKGNKREVKIEHTSGGEHPLSHRAGLLYDLGAYYKLNELALEQKSSFAIYNFSVYVGNKLDATILEKKIGEGGGSGSDLFATLKCEESVRYVLIMFDHVSDATNKINMYTYKPTLTQVEIFGEKTADIVADSYGTNILLKNTSGRVYQVSGDVPHNIDYKPDYSKLVYKNLYDNNTQYRRYGTDFEKKDEKKPEYYEDPSLKIITDGNTDKSVLIDTGTNRANGFIETKRIAIFYDLGGWYDLSTVILKQDLSNGTAIRNYSVYAGAFGDSRLLDNRVGTGGGTFESLISELSGATSVRYIVVVLDHVSSATSNLSNYYTYRPFITELECYGTENKNPTIPVDTKNNILRSADVKASMVFVDHEFSWTDSFEKGSFNYTSDKYHIQSELAPDTLETWTDGKGAPSAYWSSGISSKNNITKRKGVLFDLGGFYNLNGIELDVAAVVNDGRYIYDYTVYAGAVSNGSILSNLVAHGGSNEEILTSDITYNRSVRYVLVMFNKLGTDPGNLNDDGTRSLASKVNKQGALPGCTWADSGIHLGEISIYGNKGVDTTHTITYTDPDSKVFVEVITYDNDVKIETIKISRVPLTDLQKGTLKLDAMYPVGDAYQVEFYDKDGNRVTDMKGRQFRVCFPMIYGDETAYAINDDSSLEKMDLTLDMENNTLVYTSAPEKSVFNFAIASYTNPDDGKSNKDNLKTDADEKADIDIILVSVISTAALIVAGSFTGLGFFLKRRRNRII